MVFKENAQNKSTPVVKLISCENILTEVNCLLGISNLYPLQNCNKT